MASIALIFNPTAASSHATVISPVLKDLCSYWVLLDDRVDDAIVDDIRAAMDGVDGSVIKLASLQAGTGAEYLGGLLEGRASHLFTLRPGMVIECDPGMHIDPDAAAEQVLHLSPARDRAFWQTSIVANAPDLWELDLSQGLCGLKQQAPAGRNRSVRILDHTRYTRLRAADDRSVKHLLDEYHSVPSAHTAAAIGDALFARREYPGAVHWYWVTLGAEPATRERWRVHYRAALSLLRSDADWAVVEEQLALAFDTDPDRMEPLYYLVQHFREIGDLERATDLARIAVEIEEPAEGIEFEPEIYRYGLPFAYADCLLAQGEDARCIVTVNDTLRGASLTEPQRRELASLRARAHARLCPVYPVSIRRNNRLLVVITFRNAGDFLHRCIDSIRQQDYPDYRVILVDDASTDGALSGAGMLDSRFTPIINEQRMGALHNQVNAIRCHARDDDIVVHLDGDDWLAHPGALACINDFFNRTRCWLMYGQYETSHGNYGTCEPIVADAGPLREQIQKMHFPMHIRAYRAGLLGELLKQDPDLQALKDEAGVFLDAISDLALMNALIQLAGAANTRYNEEILYVYNRANPHSHYQARESLDLQRRQSESAARKPPLQRVRQPGDVVDAQVSRKKATTLLVALDGATPGLIEQWANAGELPNFATLLQRCRGTDIRSPAGFGNDVFWNSLCTGFYPDETGYFFRMKWLPADHKFEFQEPARQVKKRLFWTTLADSDAELAIIDMPEVMHGGRVNGLEISSWLPHARHTAFACYPEELEADLTSRFGIDPLGGSTERLTPRSDDETARDIGLLLQSIRQETRAATHYLERGGWDLFAVGYQQVHSVGHQFWHLHDRLHPRYSDRWQQRHGDPLLETYKGIDEGIGQLLGAAGMGVNLVVIAGLTMGTKLSCNTILDQMLWEIEAHDRRLAGEPCPGIERRDLRRYIALHSNHLSGAIRLNLAGREAGGLVSPGRDYEDTLSRLIECLAQVTDTETGLPAVSEFIPVHQQYSGSRVDELPDLLVVWNRANSLREVVSPYFEPIKVHVRDVLDTRTGDHVTEATLYSNVDILSGKDGVIDVTEISSRLTDLIASRH